MDKITIQNGLHQKNVVWITYIALCASCTWSDSHIPGIESHLLAAFHSRSDILMCENWVVTIKWVGISKDEEMKFTFTVNAIWIVISQLKENSFVWTNHSPHECSVYGYNWNQINENLPPQTYTIAVLRTVSLELGSDILLKLMDWY